MEVKIEYWFADIYFEIDEEEQDKLVNEFLQTYVPEDYEEKDLEEIKKLELAHCLDFAEFEKTYAFKSFLHDKFYSRAEEMEEMRNR